MTVHSAQEILQRHGIEYLATSKGKFTTQCPDCGHGYLNVEQKRDGLVWHCHSCGYGGGEKFEQRERKAEPALGPVKAVFDYTDENGALLFQVLRFEPIGQAKQFRQRTGPDQQKWSIKGVRIVPFRLPELIEDIARDHVVFVVEGEKDVNTLRAHGVPATCAPMGAGKWWPQFNEIFRGADVVICGDNDQPGRDHVTLVAGNLHGVARRLRVLDLAEHWLDIEASEDVSDWFAIGYTVEGLWQIVERLPDWKPDASKGNGHDAGETFAKAESEQATQASNGSEEKTTSALGVWDGDDDERLEPRGWLLGNIFCRGFMSSLLADGGVGKTALRIAQLMSCAIGRPLTGDHVFQRCRVLIVSLEDNKTELKRRVRAARLHHNVHPTELKGWLFLSAPGAAAGKLMTQDKRGQLVPGGLADGLEKILIEHKIDLVSIDPFIKAHSVEENNNSAIDAVVQVLTDLAAKHNLAVDAPHHMSKGSVDPGNASRGRGASAMKDAGRLVYTLTAMSPDEAEAFDIDEEQRRQFVRIDSAKVNIAPPLAKAKWFRLVGVSLGNATDLYPNGDEVQTVEPWQPPDAWSDLSVATLNAMLDYIEAGVRDDNGQPTGERFSNAPNAKERAVWPVILRFTPDKPEAQCRIIIRRWLDNEVLVSKQYYSKAARREVSGLWVNPAKRPGTKTET
jgi:AAA domain